MNHLLSARSTGLRHLTAAIALAGAYASVACGSTPGGPAQAPPQSPDVWAVVDGREIHRDEVERAYRRMAQTSPAPAGDEALAYKLSLLNELILQNLLVARAGALGIEVSDAELEGAFNERRQNITDEAFQKELASRGLSVEDMRAGLRQELIADKVLEREIGSKISVGDEEVAAFYNANRAQFHLAEPAYRLAQIVITPVRDQEITNRQNDDATTPEAAERKARMLMERLRDGTPFSALAMDYSEDAQTAPLGGDLGFVPLSALKQAPPVLRDAVLKTEPGAVTRVTVGGAHTLVLVVAREAAGQRELSDPSVREGIVETLRERREQLLRSAFLTTVRNDATVVNYLARQVVADPARTPTLAPAPARQP